ncbi:hypothetical protein CCR75_003584 [Bremia lactucae]|uniref:Timeless N-terminal domain-containing protein n=1 Tax=Bremia lactucae TaxID=4779 RepID=A0A976IE55_BRELC|nr:hypothetical protein CCR75_003584 [Bremia lactucae]
MVENDRSVQRDEELDEISISSSNEGAEANEPELDADMMNELLLVCSNLGMLRIQTVGEAPVFMRGEKCAEWVYDLQRAIRRDHAKQKLVAKQLGKWKILQKKLLPLLVNHQHDRMLVVSILKVLVMLTMKPSRDSSNIALQLKYLRQYKHEFLRCGVISILMTMLVDPLSRGGARADQDYLCMELALTLIRNLLAVPNEDLSYVTSTTSYYNHLQEDLVHSLHEESVYEMVLLFSQDIDSAEHRDWNLLIMEIICLTLECSQPDFVAAFAKKQLAREQSKRPDGQETILSTSLRDNSKSRSTQNAGEDLLAKLKNETKSSTQSHSTSRRHTNFGGVLRTVGPTGRMAVVSDFSKTICGQVPEVAKKPVSLRRRKKSTAPAQDISEIFGGKGIVNETDERLMSILQSICDAILAKSYAQLTDSLKAEFRRGSDKLIFTDRLQYFFLVGFLLKYHRLKVQALKSHYKHQLKAAQKQAELQSALNVSAILVPIPKKPDYHENSVLSTLDMFSFNFVLQSIENYAATKYYFGMTLSVQLLAEMMAYLAELATSDDLRFQRIADSVQHKIFYERDFLDRLPVLLKFWSPGLFSKAYEVDVVTLTHLVFKVLDSQGTIKVLSRRKAFLDKKCKKIEVINGEPKSGDIADDRSTDEENTEKQTQLVMEMQRKEADFDVRKYFSSMVSADTIRMYCSILSNYRENSPSVNHYIHSFFYRLKHFKIQQEEWTMQPMLFNIHALLLFNTMLQDTHIRHLPDFKTFLDFIRGVVRDFFTFADKNNLLFVEVFLRQAYPSKSCMLIQRSYEDSVSKSKSEAIALGQEKQIEALNESRRHRIALDHEELDGENEFHFAFDQSDFQASSLESKKGEEDEDETANSTETSSLNLIEAASIATHSTQGYAPISRAAAERAKSWSRVEDRYLAKVYTKFCQLPFVYEVISQEDMFQERDRTPEQIEQRVKFLELQQMKHDSLFEDDIGAATDGGQVADTVEKNLALLDTARPRRRLCRKVGLSDDDSDEDLDLLREPASIKAKPCGADTVTTNDTTTRVINGAFREMTCMSVKVNLRDVDKESQPYDLNKSQELERESQDQLEFPVKAHNIQGSESAKKITDINSKTKNLSPDHIVSTDTFTKKTIIETSYEAGTSKINLINVPRTHGSPDVDVVEEATNTESHKRGRASNEDVPMADVPAKKIYRAIFR